MHISILCTEFRKRRSENRKKYTEKVAELKQIPAGRILAVYDGHRFPGGDGFCQKTSGTKFALHTLQEYDREYGTALYTRKGEKRK